MITDHAHEQHNEDGRPLVRYILTPVEWQQLEDELADMNITGACVRPLRSVTLAIPGQKEPLEVIKGPP